MIDRFVKELVERLEEEAEEHKKYWQEFGDEDSFGGMNATMRAIEIVNQLAEEQNNGWIPCSERLPSERDWYLALFKEGDSDFVLVPRVADYMGKENVCTTNEGWLIIDLEDEIGINAYYKKLECIAWQPLPAPFKPKE